MNEKMFVNIRIRDRLTGNSVAVYTLPKMVDFLLHV